MRKTNGFPFGKWWTFRVGLSHLCIFFSGGWVLLNQMYICIYIYMCIYVYIYMYVYVCCMYIYICIYIYYFQLYFHYIPKYVYIYVYTLTRWYFNHKWIVKTDRWWTLASRIVSHGVANDIIGSEAAIAMRRRCRICPRPVAIKGGSMWRDGNGETAKRWDATMGTKGHGVWDWIRQYIYIYIYTYL